MLALIISIGAGLLTVYGARLNEVAGMLIWIYSLVAIYAMAMTGSPMKSVVWPWSALKRLKARWVGDK